MDIAFRTNTTVINQLACMVSENDVQAIALQKIPFKKKMRTLVIPSDGIIKGDTLKDTYFPSGLFDGSNYDVFISHSHNNEEEAHLLAAWLKKYKKLSCFVDSFAWGSADQLLKEIDDKYCYRKHSKTYDYKKRNFTTSHVHAILSMALLDTILRSKYCIFIESTESVPLNSGLKKKTLSPWLYEEIKYMQLLQPKRETKMFSEGLEKAIADCKIAYDVTDISQFPFLDYNKFTNFNNGRLLLD
ncbi:MAG: hypothetical protein SO295_07145 [Candidatus Cryptobacteroides sp.]|nr:hypothetical protein [Candidatus Cryptobacteroides sp.]